MRGFAAQAVCLLLLVGCGAPTEAPPPSPAEQVQSQTEQTAASACAIGSFIEAAGPNSAALLFPPLQRSAPWGANSADVERAMRRSAQRVRRDGSELTAYINGNQAWLGFQFVADRLVEVRERHNNPNRAPPFAGAFLRSIASAHGEPRSVEEDGGGCRAEWDVDGSTLTALWRDSEWFVDIQYSAPPAVVDGANNVGDRLGEWCDSAWPGTVSLVRGEDGGLTLSTQFERGGRVARVVVLRNGAYHDTQSSFGEYYRVGSAGELQIFDAEGFVRSARPGRCAP